MWVVPGAQQRFIKNKSAGVRDKTLGLILHVQAGNGELTDWFNNPGSDASSCWQAMKDGRVFQFGDPDVDKFWTQSAGNPDYGAVESEGVPSEPLTPGQIEGIAQIYAKGHAEEGWPFQLAEKPGDRGLGWHGMGGAAWGGHTQCPGDLRKAQRQQILDRAKQIAGVSPTTPAPQEVGLAAEDVQKVNDYTKALVLEGFTVGGVSKPSVLAVLTETQRRVTAQSAQIAALSAAVKALAEDKGADSAALIAAVTAATEKALSGLEITLKTGE